MELLNRATRTVRQETLRSALSQTSAHAEECNETPAEGLSSHGSDHSLTTTDNLPHDPHQDVVENPPGSSQHRLPRTNEDLMAADSRDTTQIGKELLSCLSDNHYKVPVVVREKVMGLFFAMQATVVGLQTDLARAEGCIEELRKQVSEDRRHQDSYSAPDGVAPPQASQPTFVQILQGPNHATETTSAHFTAPQSAPTAPQRSGSYGSQPYMSYANNPNHVLFVTPIHPSANPGPDTITLLKSTFGNDPSGIGVKQVKLIPSRSGLTVVSADRESIDNLEKAISSNAQIKTALRVTRPPRRLPQFKISGVDPSIVPGILRANINARNNLDIPEEGFHHRTYFRDRAGNNVHIIEVSPSVYKVLKDQDRLLIGWTSCTIKENFYVAACQKCCSYGHVATRCPSERVSCPYCAEAHTADACNLENKNNVVCRECRASGKERFNHTFNAPCCQVLTARIARLRAKTIYEDTLHASQITGST